MSFKQSFLSNRYFTPYNFKGIRLLVVKNNNLLMLIFVKIELIID
jgi:hypothetical protein